MSLKFRLAFLYSLSVFIILLASAVSIFLFNENFRKDEFTKRLISEASESLDLFLSTPQPTKSIIDDLNKNAVNFGHQEKIFIFDSSHKVLYSSNNGAMPTVPPEAFDFARQKQVYFSANKRREIALIYKSRNKRSYYVFASGYDFYGRRKSDNLRLLLITSVLGGLILSAFLAFFYVRHAMQPLEELKGQIEKIDEGNLKERIAVTDKNNEVWQIAKKFNEMLDRLEQAFEQRKNFVRHASHELRTPLANMLSQTESALNKDLSKEDYRHILMSLKEDQQDMIDLTNSLLTLSRYGKITFDNDSTTIRIDDTLYQVVDFAKQAWPTATVEVEFETMPANENELEVFGNEALIRSAIQNLVKNAIQYSTDNRVKVSIIADEKGITLHFDNAGKQLTSEEQGRLFIPFFRGQNSTNKKGYGLGLSIVQRIVSVHKGFIHYTPIHDNINRFTIYMPSGK